MRRLNISIPRHLIPIISFFLLAGCTMLNPKATPDFTVEVAAMDFVFVKGGTFQMGSSDRSNEQPIHSVTIPDLFVGMHEVTFEQYDRYCASTSECEPPSDENWGRGDRPVINVSWHDATAYTAWISRQTGLRLRLPSESEWEYFARAGTTSRFWAGEKFPKNKANCRDCFSERSTMTSPAGTFPPNPWEVYDTAGNVWEWVQDDYQDNYSDAPTDGSPVLLNKAAQKSLRGGSWQDSSSNMSTSSRDYTAPNRSKPSIGFRLVMLPNIKTPIPEN